MNIGAIISIVGSSGLLLSFVIYAWYTLQLVPKLMVPLLLVFIPLVCSIAILITRNKSVVKTLACVALVYPVIVLFGSGVYITASGLIQGLNSIPAVIVLLFLFSLISFSGSVKTITAV